MATDHNFKIKNGLTVDSAPSLFNGANDNSGKADFAIDVGGNPQLSLNGNQVQLGSTDQNWTGKFNYDGTNVTLGAWDKDLKIFTQGGGSATNKAILFSPQAAGGSTTEIMRVIGDGRVGINVGNPSDNDLGINEPALHVKSNTNTNSAYNLAARFEGGNDADNTGVAVAFNHSNDRGLLIEAGRQSSDRGIVHFGVITSGGSVNRTITMKQDGSNYRVGINDTDPTYTLDVNGSFRATGSITSNSSLGIASDLFKGATYPNNSFLDFDDDSGYGGVANTTTLASVGSMHFIMDSNNNGSDNFVWLDNNVAPSSATALMRLDANSKLYLDSSTDHYLQYNGNMIRHQNSVGYIDIGPSNTSWGHINTDRASFWFNKRLTVDEGLVQSYDEDLILRRAQNSSHEIIVQSGTIVLKGNTQISGGMMQMTSGDVAERNYYVTTNQGGGDFLLGKIESSGSTDGGLAGTIVFAYDYGTDGQQHTLHFNFAQRSGTARGTWWYEGDDHETSGNEVWVEVIDVSASSDMYVWLRVGDYARCFVKTWSRQGASFAGASTLSSATITTGTKLFDTRDNPTAEIHAGVITAHGSASALNVKKSTGSGVVQEWYTGTTKIGQANVVSDVQLAIGSGDAGILFNQQSDAVYPWNVGSNIGSNNALDLGISTRQWKDFYMGGLIYLDGSAATNASNQWINTVNNVGGKSSFGRIEIYSNTYNTTSDLMITDQGVIRSGNNMFLAAGGNFTVGTASTSNSDAFNGYNSNVTTRFQITQSGDVVIGNLPTTNPNSNGHTSTSVNAPLHVYRSGLANSGTQNLLLLEHSSGDYTADPLKLCIEIRGQDTNNQANFARICQASVNDTDYGENNEATSNIILGMTQNGSYYERAIFTGGGKFGLNTTNPSEVMHVVYNSNGTSTMVMENQSTGTAARAGMRWLSDAAQMDAYATGSAYNGVTGWADSGVISTSSNTSGGLKLNAQSSGIYFQYGTSTIGHITSTGFDVTGAFTATTKSFDIEHPTKEGKRLHHGVLEGPEHAVYVRGKSNSYIIELPEYWTGLVHEDSITVQLTPIGGQNDIWVENIEDNKVYINCEREMKQYFYFIQAERKDVERFEVEYES